MSETDNSFHYSRDSAIETVYLRLIEKRFAVRTRRDYRSVRLPPSVSTNRYRRKNLRETGRQRAAETSKRSNGRFSRGKVSHRLLSCFRYDLETDKLYSITWYKDHEEFYRYVPRGEPTKHSYRVEGVKVDVSRNLAHPLPLFLSYLLPLFPVFPLTAAPD